VTPRPNPQDVDLVIFHAYCADGYTAAWAAWKLLGDKAEYISALYGNEPPDVKGKNVAIVDFSFPPPELSQMLSKAKSLIVLDHHKTAKKDLEHHKDNTIFDLDKSGAVLSWEFFHPDKPLPILVRYVQDRDLWRWKMAGTKEFSAALQIQDMKFEVWDKIDESMRYREAKESFFAQGKAVQAHITQLSKSHAKHARLMTLRGVRMWCVNATNIISETGEALRTKVDHNGEEPGVSLSWFYDFDADSYRCSLRSRDDRADVSVLAKGFGGGGHPNAAGFEYKGDIRNLLANFAD
jgi:uncharacterized protein